jgi:hypothetical protein
MAQTAVNLVPARAFEGMLADGAPMRDIISRLAKAPSTPFIPFGKAVSQNTADETDQVRLPASATDVTLRLMGIAIAESSIEHDDVVAWGHFSDGMSIPVLRVGRIWVISEVGHDIGDGVFVRHTTPGGSPPLASRGSFRKDADTANASQVSNAQWLTAGAAGGLALLGINLP